MNNQPVRRRKGRLRCGLFAFCCISTSVAGSQTTGVNTAIPPGHPIQYHSSAVASLEPGTPIDTYVSGEDTHEYRMHVKAGQFVHVVVMQFSIHIRLELFGAHRKLASAENPDTTTGLQQISTIATSTGRYDLRLIAEDKTAAPGTCRVVMEPPHLPGDADNSRILAERAFANARTKELNANSLASRLLAAKRYEAILPLWRKAADNYQEAVTLNVIAAIYGELGKAQDAINYYDRALDFWRAAHDREMESMTHNYIATLYDDNGDKQKAIDEFTLILASTRQSNSQRAELYSLIGLGKVYFESNDHTGALLQLDHALTLAKQLSNYPTQAAALDSIGKIRDYLGDAKTAIDDYRQALTIEQTLDDRPARAETLNKIGGVYYELGEEEEALRYYREALSLVIQFNDLREQARIYNNIALVLDDLKKRRAALNYCSLALPLWRRAGDRAEEGRTLNNIGFIYHNLGANRKALFYYRRALSIAQQMNDRDNESMTVHNIGVAYDGLGDMQNAWTYETRGFLLFRNSNDFFDEGLALSDLMHLWKNRSPALAILFGKEAVSKYQQVMGNIRGLGTSVQRAFVLSKDDTYRELAALLISADRLPEALTVLDMLKVEEYFEYTHHRGSPGSEAESIALTKSESQMTPLSEATENAKDILDAYKWSELKRNAHRTSQEQIEYDTLSGEIAKHNLEFAAWCNALYPELGGGEGANRRIGDLTNATSTIQKLLREFDPSTIAVYTLVAGDKYYIVLVTASETVKYVGSTSSQQLNSEIYAFVQAVTFDADESQQKSASKALYDVLVKPFEMILKSKPPKTVLWSLDGWLRYIPMSALYDGSQYLAERFANVVITEPDSGRLAPARVSDWRGVAMGVSKDYIRLGELPSVPEELDAIITSADRKSSHGPVPGTILLDDSFTVKNMEDALSEPPAVVHIATHYHLNSSDESKSYLLLGGKDIGGDGYRLTLSDFWTDPRLDLDGVELITLAGCQTQRVMQAPDGREIDALAERAQKKGAKAVIATLWDVDDASSRPLMQEFYRLWTTQRMAKSEALRRAQLELMRGELRVAPPPGFRGATIDTAADSRLARDTRYSAPYYWAPFVLMGNWN